MRGPSDAGLISAPRRRDQRLRLLIENREEYAEKLLSIPFQNLPPLTLSFLLSSFFLPLYKQTSSPSLISPFNPSQRFASAVSHSLNSKIPISLLLAMSILSSIAASIYSEASFSFRSPAIEGFCWSIFLRTLFGFFYLIIELVLLFFYRVWAARFQKRKARTMRRKGWIRCRWRRMTRRVITHPRRTLGRRRGIWFVLHRNLTGCTASRRSSLIEMLFFFFFFFCLYGYFYWLIVNYGYRIPFIILFGLLWLESTQSINLSKF